MRLHADQLRFVFEIASAAHGAGTVALKKKYYDVWAPGPWQPEWETGCGQGGICGSAGWRRLGDRIDSGVGNSRSTPAWSGKPSARV